MKNNKKEAYWSQFASDFEEKQSFVAGNEVLLLTYSEVLNESNLGKVLELGCGTGLYTKYLQKVSNEIIATDFSDEMIEVAKQKRGDLDKVSFIKANALDLQFEDESFNTVFMGNLIHIIEDPKKVIQESNRVLKKGGKLIITSFAADQMSFLNKMSIAFRYIKTFGKPSKESTKVRTNKKNIESLLINNGFMIVKNKVVGEKTKAIYINCTKNIN